jgi:hypothetical protein
MKALAAVVAASPVAAVIGAHLRFADGGEVRRVGVCSVGWWACVALVGLQFSWLLCVGVNICTSYIHLRDVGPLEGYVGSWRTGATCCTHHTAPECTGSHQASPVRCMPFCSVFPPLRGHLHSHTHTHIPPAPHTTPTWLHRLWVSTCFSGVQCPLQAPACEEACEEACTGAAALGVWPLSAQLGTV